MGYRQETRKVGRIEREGKEISAVVVDHRPFPKFFWVLYQNKNRISLCRIWTQNNERKRTHCQIANVKANAKRKKNRIKVKTATNCCSAESVALAAIIRG